MAYDYELTLEAAQEIDKAVKKYEQKFSSGVADFLTAYDDTIERILKMPEAGGRRSKKDPDIRGRQLEADKGRKVYARKFPYLLLYKVYEADEKVVIFQLWPTASALPIREGP